MGTLIIEPAFRSLSEEILFNCLIISTVVAYFCASPSKVSPELTLIVCVAIEDEEADEDEDELADEAELDCELFELSEELFLA